MKKLFVIAATSLVLSASAFAGTIHNSTKLLSDGYSTQSEAYEAGFNIVDDLKAASGSQLDFKLQVPGDSADIEGVEVTLEEFAVERGQVQYRAVVDVDYSYSRSDS